MQFIRVGVLLENFQKSFKYADSKAIAEMLIAELIV